MITKTKYPKVYVANGVLRVATMDINIHNQEITAYSDRQARFLLAKEIKESTLKKMAIPGFMGAITRSKIDIRLKR